MTRITDIPYRPNEHGIGIVHFGTGAFHRAHQAVYTDDVLARLGGDWRILGVSLQSTRIADALNAQNGIYSLVQRDENGSAIIRRIGSISEVVAASRDSTPVFRALASKDTHVVSMTVTEKAYGILRDLSGVDIDHPSITSDLANPDHPTGIIGMLVKGLKMRREAGLPSFTVLCCDNLPDNGDMVRAGVLDFAKRVDDKLADWIAANTCFPNTMVDRITPATTDTLIDEINAIDGIEDKVPVETEPFTQWVVEDRFSGPRPAWENVGVLFVKDVAPYEKMKLRMLNGAHSMLAYTGFVSGCKYVRDVMAHKELSTLVDKHMRAAAQTLEPLSEIDFDDYRRQLISRFENPNIAHETYQIAMDGTQKLPQRIFAPALDSLDSGLPINSFAFATAAWMRYCLGQLPDGSHYDLRDPREAEISKALSVAGRDAASMFQELSGLPDFMPVKLAQSETFKETAVKYLDLLLGDNIEDIARQITKTE